jgi:eukaryotic-like serine/threonine-protein kinase
MLPTQCVGSHMHDDLPALGSMVGPWLILECLDSGSFGMVYRARRAGHPEAQPVALKMARRPRDPRFEREAKLLQLGLPGQPKYDDQGCWTAPNGHSYPYVVMELVKGLTLYDWFGRGRTSREVLSVLAQVAGTLAAAHARGAVHRDVKGDNVRVEGSGRAVLVDWGSGWFEGARPLTDTTQPPGTTAYRPPEQRLFAERCRKDETARWRSSPSDDLYALGVTFYRCVTGGYLPPMSEGGVLEVREVPRPSDLCTLSLDLESLILRLLSADREQRGTAEQLTREALDLSNAAGEAADQLIDPVMPPELAAAMGGPSSDGADDELLSESDTSEPMASSSTDSTRAGRRRRPEVGVPDWLAQALVALAGGLVVVLVLLAVLLLLNRAGEPAPRWMEDRHQEVAHFAPDAGVGDEALSTVEDMPHITASAAMTLAKPMPSKAFPGQKKPPCDAATAPTSLMGSACVPSSLPLANPPQSSHEQPHRHHRRTLPRVRLRAARRGPEPGGPH